LAIACKRPPLNCDFGIVCVKNNSGRWSNTPDGLKISAHLELFDLNNIKLAASQNLLQGLIEIG